MSKSRLLKAKVPIEPPLKLAEDSVDEIVERVQSELLTVINTYIDAKNLGDEGRVLYVSAVIFEFGKKPKAAPEPRPVLEALPETSLGPLSAEVGPDPEEIEAEQEVEVDVNDEKIDENS